MAKRTGTARHLQTCLACGALSTIRAHLVPQAFAREVRGCDQTFALTKGITPAFRLTQNGLFDDSILCRDCDNLLGRNEKYALETFKTLREATITKLNTHVGVSPISGDRLIRFAAGISWKFCVTKSAYGRIDIGSYAHILKQIAFDEKSIPLSVDMFMVRLKALHFEEHFFRAPKPGRQQGVNFIRLALGAFLMFLKIDKRPSPNISLPEIWMKGRSEVVFPVLPMDKFEEGLFIKQAWQRDEKLMNFVLSNIRKQVDQRGDENGIMKRNRINLQ
jgi:hypothetical protein